MIFSKSSFDGLAEKTIWRYLPKEQDPNMPKLNIVEERGKKSDPGFLDFRLAVPKGLRKRLSGCGKR